MDLAGFLLLVSRWPGEEGLREAWFRCGLCQVSFLLPLQISGVCPVSAGPPSLVRPRQVAVPGCRDNLLPEQGCCPSLALSPLPAGKRALPTPNVGRITCAVPSSWSLHSWKSSFFPFSFLRQEEQPAFTSQPCGFCLLQEKIKKVSSPSCTAQEAPLGGGDRPD